MTEKPMSPSEVVHFRPPYSMTMVCGLMAEQVWESTSFWDRVNCPDCLAGRERFRAPRGLGENGPEIVVPSAGERVLTGTGKHLLLSNPLRRFCDDGEPTNSTSDPSAVRCPQCLAKIREFVLATGTDQRRERADVAVTLMMSQEIIDQLSDWTGPVQVRLTKVGISGWDLEIREMKP